MIRPMSGMTTSNSQFGEKNFFERSASENWDKVTIDAYWNGYSNSSTASFKDSTALPEYNDDVDWEMADVSRKVTAESNQEDPDVPHNETSSSDGNAQLASRFCSGKSVPTENSFIYRNPEGKDSAALNEFDADGDFVMREGDNSTREDLTKGNQMTAVLPLRKLNPRERKWKKPRKRKKPRTKKKPRKIVQPSTPDTESALAVVAPQDRSMRNYTWSINKPRQSSLKQSQQVSDIIQLLPFQNTFQDSSASQLFGDIGRMMANERNCPQPPMEDVRRLALESRAIKQNSSISQIGHAQCAKPFFGKTGLINLGNTCYMNVAIQCLYMVPSFCSKLLSRSLNLTKETDPVTYSSAKLLAFLKLSERPAISPADFYNALRPFWYKPGTQQDLAEFLERFINILEFEDVKRCTRHGPGIPKVSELFKGQFTVDVQCMNCSAISRRLETFAVVTLALPNTVSNLGRGRDVQIEDADLRREFSRELNGNLSEVEDVRPSVDRKKPLNVQDLLHSYVSRKILHGQKQLHCNSCSSLQHAEPTLVLTDYPKVLILKLDHNPENAETHARGKILQGAQYLDNLIVPVRMEAVNVQELDGDKNDRINNLKNTLRTVRIAKCKYFRLKSVGVHVRISPDIGHYRCFGNAGPIESNLGRPESGTNENILKDDWYIFDDESVFRENAADLKKYLEQHPSDTPYVFMYEESSADYPASTEEQTRLLWKFLVESDNIKFRKVQ